MSENEKGGLSRRELLGNSGKLAAVASLASFAIPTVHAGENNTLQVALVGCGGRGTGAADNALAVKDQGPIKLVAMADVFEDRLNGAVNGLKDRRKEQFDVPPERRFVGFDAYKKAMDCLNPGDVVILATPPAFRWVHYTYAIEKGLNVFMEKPVTVDGPTSKRMLELNKKAVEKNLKVGVGLMCRHCEARGELYDRIRNGEIGDITLLRAYRATGPTGSAFARKHTGPKNEELMYQIRNFHAFLWASGGAVSDFLIHNIDECCWMKDAWPVSAKAFGGRHYRNDYVDQNFDVYHVEYTFADGSKLMLYGRGMDGCHSEFASYAHGTKNSAVISTAAHAPAKSRIYKGQMIDSPNKEDLLWKFGKREPNPYQLEWDHLIAAIRQDQTYNEVDRGVEASLITSMGRLAAHTGKVVTRDEMLNHEHEFAPELAALTVGSPAPVQADDNGLYPIPQPGIKRTREY